MNSAEFSVSLCDISLGKPSILSPISLSFFGREIDKSFIEKQKKIEQYGLCQFLSAFFGRVHIYETGNLYCNLPPLTGNNSVPSELISAFLA